MKDQSKTPLLQRIAELEVENSALIARIDVLEGIPSLRSGIRGESLVATLVHGRMTIHTAPHDVVVANGIKLEVKFSRLNTPNQISKSQRWSWNHPMGQKLGKDFDRLLLIGEADPRYKLSYKDPDSPYVIFDVPRDRVAAMNQNDNHISITTNPNRSGRGTSRILLFRHFQTTLKELEQRYGITRKSKDHEY